MSSLLDDPALDDELSRQPELRQEVVKMMAALRLNHRLRLLEKLVANRADASGRKLHLAHVLIILVHVLTQEGEEMVNEHPRSLRKLLRICHRQLDDRSLRRLLAAKTPRTSYEREVVGEAKVLTRLVEELEAQLLERKGEKASLPAAAAEIKPVEAKDQEAKGREQQAII
jgi:hypothetical protein